MPLLRRRSRSDARPLCGGTRSDGVGSGFVNTISGQGGEADRQAWTGYSGGCPLSPREVDDMMTNYSVARRIARRPAEDSLRQGHLLRGTVSNKPLDVQIGGPETEKEEAPDPIAVWAKRFGLLGLTLEADSQARAHGLALWVYGVDDGAMSSEPLVSGSIRRLLWVRVASRQSVSVAAWGVDPAQPRFEEPTHYQVTFTRSGFTAIYHWTRVQEWIGVELSTEQRAQNQDNGGGSVFDLVWSALKGYGVSHQQALEALSLLSQGVWSNDNLARAIDGGNAADVADTYENTKIGGGLYGDYVVSAGESYSIVGRPVTGIAEVGAMMTSALVVASGMTEPVLLGAVPSSGGLSSDMAGLIRSWYDSLAIQQPERFGTPLTRFWTIASRAHNGPTQGVPILDLAIGWPSLWQLTDEERANVRKINAEARTLDVGAPTVSIGEGRSDTTLTSEYELAPEGVSTIEEEDVPIEDIEIADADIMPPGERPLSLMEARDIIGVKSNAGVRSFIDGTGTPLFRIGASYRVFETHIRAAMREAQVL